MNSGVMHAKSVRLVRVACAAGMCLWLPVFLIEESLLKFGVLNTKDLAPFIGNESGSLTDYLLNVWHWDGASFLLLLLAAPCFFISLELVISRRCQRHDKSA